MEKMNKLRLIAVIGVVFAAMFSINFVSANNYVSKLLSEDYKIIHPASLIPSEKWILVRATEVRVEMAKSGNWKRLVPNVVVNYFLYIK